MNVWVQLGNRSKMFKFDLNSNQTWSCLRCFSSIPISCLSLFGSATSLIQIQTQILQSFFKKSLPQILQTKGCSGVYLMRDTRVGVGVSWTWWYHQELDVKQRKGWWWYDIISNDLERSGKGIGKDSRRRSQSYRWEGCWSVGGRIT